MKSWYMALVIGLCGVAYGADDTLSSDSPNPHPKAFNLYWENDSPFFKPNHATDRWYTNGVGVSVMWEPDFALTLANWLPFAEQFGTPDRVPFGFTAGQLMFTPVDTDAAALVSTDRPYAGYLYGGVIIQRINSNTMDHFQLEIGQTGDASLGERAQKWVHDFYGDAEPMGWDHQIDDEFQAQLYVRKRWKASIYPQAADTADESAFSVELLPEIGGALGTVYRHVEGSVILRAGWHLPDDFGPSRLQSITPPPAATSTGWSAYGYGRATGRAVQHNLFVEGSYSRGGHGLDPKAIVGELQAGINVAYTQRDWAIELGYSQTYTSPEFEGQPAWHGHGSWTLSFQCWF